MVTLSSRRPVSGREARIRVLARFLEDLRLLRDSGITVPDTADAGWLQSDPWIRHRIDVHFRDCDRLDPSSMLVVHGTALLAKCDEDLTRLQQLGEQSAELLYAAQAALMLDTAIGSALVRETQQRIDDLLKSGALDEARNLSRFHHVLRNTVFGVRKSIDGEAREQAESLADQMTMRGGALAAEPGSTDAERDRSSIRDDARRSTGPATQADATHPESAPRTESWVERRAKRRTERGAKPSGVAVSSSARMARTRLLAVGFLVSCLLWLAGWLPDARRNRRPPFPRPTGDAASVVVRIDDRAPSLFVFVDGRAWRELGESGEEELVRELSRLAATRGYSGLLLRDERGLPVARWHRGDDVVLLAKVEETPGRRAILPAVAGPDRSASN